MTGYTREELATIKTPYEAVTHAKAVLTEIGFITYEEMEELFAFVHFLKHKHVKAAVGFATVLELATFREEGGGFGIGLPATKHCMKEFKYFGKKLAKGKPLALYCTETYLTPVEFTCKCGYHGVHYGPETEIA